MIDPCRDQDIALLANQFVCRGEQMNARSVRNLGHLGILDNQEEEQAFWQHYQEIAISMGRAGLLLEFESDTETLF